MLKWSLRHGKSYAATMEAGNEWKGDKMPDLQPGLNEWYDDFHNLSSDRQIGMAVGPIPHSTIERHTATWPDDDAQMFYACMRAMDVARDEKHVSSEDPKAYFERSFG